jgi:hypothetical protein
VRFFHFLNSKSNFEFGPVGNRPESARTGSHRFGEPCLDLLSALALYLPLAGSSHRQRARGGGRGGGCVFPRTRGGLGVVGTRRREVRWGSYGGCRSAYGESARISVNGTRTTCSVLVSVPRSKNFDAKHYGKTRVCRA